MARVFLGLGSNVGDRLRFLQRAVDELRDIDGVMIVQVSSVYETDPVGVKNQGEFLNVALEAEVLLTPEELLRAVKRVEKEVGRKQSERWGPREIDIDILLYNDRTINERELRIPHPELAQRKFVLIPLRELDEQIVHPVQGKTVDALLKMCANDSGVRKSSLTIAL